MVYENAEEKKFHYITIPKIEEKARDGRDFSIENTRNLGLLNKKWDSTFVLQPSYRIFDDR